MSAGIQGMCHHTWFVYVHISVNAVCVCVYQRRPEERIRSLETGVSGSYKPLNVCARNQTQVLWKNNKCCLPLSLYPHHMITILLSRACIQKTEMSNFLMNLLNSLNHLKTGLWFSLHRNQKVEDRIKSKFPGGIRGLSSSQPNCRAFSQLTLHWERTW